MNQTRKREVGWWLLLAAKGLTTAVTGYDTWLLSQANGYPWPVSVLHVLLIDIIFLAFLWRASEEGTSQDALAERPFDWVAASVMYGAILLVGIEETGGLFAWALRAAGMLVLLKTGWDIFKDNIVKRLNSRNRPTPAQNRARHRARMMAIGYYLMTVALLPVTMVIAGVTALVDTLRDVGLSIGRAGEHPPTVQWSPPPAIDDQREHPPLRLMTSHGGTHTTVQGDVVNADEHPPVRPMTSHDYSSWSPEERREFIRRALGDDMDTPDSHFADLFDVSVSTIRRDRQKLGIDKS